MNNKVERSACNISSTVVCLLLIIIVGMYISYRKNEVNLRERNCIKHKISQKNSHHEQNSARSRVRLVCIVLYPP
jgi:hypothetical protein